MAKVETIAGNKPYGYLTARAFLVVGNEKQEVNAKIEIPKYIPAELVGMDVPFKMLQVPAAKYDMVAVFESPRHGRLKARKKTEVKVNKEAKVDFLFRVSGEGGGFGGSKELPPAEGRRGGDSLGHEAERVYQHECPTCGRLFGHVTHTLIERHVVDDPEFVKKYGRRRDGQPLLRFYCDHCNGEFIPSKYGLVPYHPVFSVDEAAKFPMSCPECKSRVKHVEFKTPGQGTIHRLECTNPHCTGEPLIDPNGIKVVKPWFMDLGERDFQHWKMEKARMQQEALGINSDTGIPERLIAAIERFVGRGTVRDQEARIDEGKRIVQDLRKRGFSSVNMKRFGLDEDNLDHRQLLREFGLDKDEHEMYSGEERKAYDEESKKTEAKLAGDRSGRRWERRGGIGRKIRPDEVDEAERGEADQGRRVNVKRFFDHVERHSEGGFKRHGVGTMLLFLIGIIVGSQFGWQFMVGFTCWAGRNMLPNAKRLRIKPNHGDNRLGSLTAHEDTDEEHYDNRVSTGLSVTKSLLKIASLTFLALGFFSTELPFRGFLLLVFFFASYFSLPAEYSTEEAEKFMEGILRVPVALVLSFVVFWGIFKSPELAWLCLAFFGVIPTPTEKQNLAVAIGRGASGATATYETVDKFLFLGLMALGLWAVLGPGFGVNMDLDIGTLFGNIFLYFWIISLIGGVTSPSSVRPYTGIVMLILVFFFYSSGGGEQIVGQGFFGAWWPSIHNTMMTVIEPMNQGFSALSGTFGQTFMLLTNPVGYAHQITEGTYVQSPTGLTGAYGVELEQINLPHIYIGTRSLATLNVRNVGPRDATNVEVTLSLQEDLPVKMIPSAFNMQSGEGYIEEFVRMEPSFVVPLVFSLDATDCETINKQGWLSKLSKRNEYIRTTMTVEYTYEVDSWMPLEIISNREWRDRTAKGTFTQSKVLSYISTSPAKLSIGSFEQPIVAGNRPFYLGLNLTSAEGANSEIVWDHADTVISFEVPEELDKNNLLCTPTAKREPSGSGIIKYTWSGKDVKNKAIYCTSSSIADFDTPSITYYIRADAKFRFRKWVTKDTEFAFDDACSSSTTGASTILLCTMDAQKALIVNPYIPSNEFGGSLNPENVTRLPDELLSDYHKRVLDALKRHISKYTITSIGLTEAGPIARFRPYVRDEDRDVYDIIKSV